MPGKRGLKDLVTDPKMIAGAMACAAAVMKSVQDAFGGSPKTRKEREAEQQPTADGETPAASDPASNDVRFRIIMAGVLVVVLLVAGVMLYRHWHQTPDGQVVATPAEKSASGQQKKSKSPKQDAASASHPVEESEEEREYERTHGVEVVHRKDGTTYERKVKKKSKSAK